MILECGFWEVDTQVKRRGIYRYFVCKHKNNPTKVKLVFIKADGLQGDKELVDFIKKEKLAT